MQFALERGLGAPPDVSIVLGDRLREWAPYVRIETRALWAAEPLRRKLKAVLRGRWTPDMKMAQEQALAIYRREIFGSDDDWGRHLIELYTWHLLREWKLEALTEHDATRASALASFTVLTRMRYKDIVASPLNLQIGARAPEIAGLVYPMIVKMPVVSLSYFLDLDAHFAFDAVRRAKHPQADDIIAFLYELLFLQQKVAISLEEFIRLVSYADVNKRQAQLINAEVNAIMAADGVFSYLKASIEKTVALVGVTHGIIGLDAKKDHKARIRALRAGLPKDFDQLFYARFLFEMIGAEHLDDLNSYRSGLLHKKGIADLQPHNYVSRDAKSVPLRKIFAVMHEQHAKNTAVLLVALAILTDELVRLDPPTFSLEDLPWQNLAAAVKARAQEGTAETLSSDRFKEEPDTGGTPGE